MDTFDDLTGKFLVATPKMPDPRFAQSVILICAHSPHEGAMGVAVNRLHGRLSLDEVLFAPAQEEVVLPDVYLGGPVGVEAGFVLYEPENPEEEKGTDTVITVCPDIILSRDRRMLEEIICGRGPKHYLFMVGYAGWGTGQLEMELTRDGWLIVPADADILFRTPAGRRWQAAGERYGIDIALFNDETGNA